MTDITDKVAEFGYTNSNGTKIHILGERLRSEKCKYTYISAGKSVENSGRITKVESDEERPRVEITIKRVDGHHHTFEGLLYGTSEKLSVFFNEDMKWIE